MKRLSSLMLKKWKDKERWTGRRRSEPFGGGEEEEDDVSDRQTHRRMLRRKSEPFGPTEEDEKTVERKSESSRKKEQRRSESNMGEEDRKDKRRTETGKGKERRKSISWLMREDKEGGQKDGKKKEADRRTLRRQSEPCETLYVQLLPLSSRKRRELMQRRTGRRTSCNEEGDRQTDRIQGNGSRERISPVGPSDDSKQTSDVSEKTLLALLA